MHATNHEMQKNYTTTDLIKFQGIIQEASKKQLQQLFQSLNQQQCQWVISNFVEQFLPHDTGRNDNISKNIDRIHNERRKNIETNEKDCAILHQLKEQIIEPWKQNKKSINTNKNTKKFDLLPKNLLSNIMSYMSCKDRNTSICLLSRIFYYASQDMIGRHSLILNNNILQKIKNGIIDQNTINQYQNIHIKSKIWNCTLSYYMTQSDIVALFTNVKCISLDYDDQWTHRNQKPQCLLVIAKHIRICAQIQQVTLKGVEIHELLSFFKQCNKLKSLTINKHTDKVDHDINIPMYKWFVNETETNFQSRLTSLCLDMSFYTKWSKKWHIMHHIHKFVNLCTLELHLCLPKNFDENRPDTNTNTFKNKLSHLQATSIQWYYCLEPCMSESSLSRKRIQFNWEHIATNNDKFYTIIPKIESWDNIVMTYHQHLLSIADNINEYTLKCPQWTNPLPSIASYKYDCKFMETFLSLTVKTVKKLNVTMTDSNFNRFKFGIKDCPSLKCAQIALTFTDDKRSFTNKHSLVHIFNDIIMLCTSKYLETVS